MGFYIDGTTKDKINWLENNGKLAYQDFCNLWHIRKENELPVCIVDNGHFTALVVIYSQDEYIRWCDPIDSRPKLWYLMPMAKIKEKNKYAVEAYYEVLEKNITGSQG